MMQLNHRADGRIEGICEHGVGHTLYNPNDWGEYTFSHGCCGKNCCNTKEFIEALKKINSMKQCPFCDFKEYSRLLDYWDSFILIESLYPVSERGHLLIIPKTHVKHYSEFTERDIISIHQLVRIGMEILMKRGFTGFNVGWNFGKSAGQTVEHIHCHIIGRKEGDVEDPRGGIRNVIPKKGNYLK